MSRREYDKDEVEDAVLQWQEKREDRLFDKILSFFENGLWYETGRWYIRGHDQEDLVQIGCLSILRSMEDWNPKGKASFKTHAWNYIKRDFQDLKSISVVRENRIQEQTYDTEIIEDILGAEPGNFKEVLCWYEIEKMPLSERERRVVKGLLGGYEKQDIAKGLKVSPMTVSWTIKDLREKVCLKKFLGQ
jgi:RNA polymerase sigma factor (sigma-70 family)